MDEIRDDQLKFVSAGQARIAGPLADLNSLADRMGGQSAMTLHAIHGSLTAVFAALLNHIAGIPDPDSVAYENDPTVDRASADPTVEAERLASQPDSRPVPSAQEASPAGNTSGDTRPETTDELL